MNLETIIVSRQNWEQCALAAGDNNSIHYDDYYKFNLPKPICPGVYFLALAENYARKNNHFELPMHVEAKFKEPVYDDQYLKIKQEVYNSRLHIYFIRDSRLNTVVAEFNFGKSLDSSMNFETLSSYETFTGEISSKELSLFNRALGLGENQTVYLTFVVGRILKNFLNNVHNPKKNRHGALLTNVEFDFFHEAVIGNINVNLFVKDDIKTRNNVINHKYEVYGNVHQNEELIGIGKGSGSYKEFSNCKDL